MTKHTATRIIQRINDKEVAVPGVSLAASACKRGTWSVELWGANGHRLHVVTTVEQWQQLANSPEE